MIESVPNVSEGQRPDVVDALIAAVRRIPRTLVLNTTADPSHNRAVFTLAGRGNDVVESLVQLVDEAVARIDLRTHRGVHPRMGAVDVVPFIPLDGARLADCVDLSHRFASIVAGRFDLPVFLYEASATAPHRRRLEDVRRGQFEGLERKLASPGWLPDYGPSRAHPTAGALITGARMPLIAFNVDLTTSDVEVARQIAARIRERDGGLPCVKALGLSLPHRGRAQVSMNLTDYTTTGVETVFDAVEREARTFGAAVFESELIGLIPAAALEGTSAERLKLTGFSASRILEHRIEELRREGGPGTLA
ncbi:MAG: glutamate formimidoyltransferase [Vicinamibacterales bacterium]